MQSPDLNGVAGVGWHTWLAPQPPPMGALPHAFPSTIHDTGSIVASPPVAAHDPTVTAGASAFTLVLHFSFALAPQSSCPPGALPTP